MILNLYFFTVSDQGQVYSWGNNFNSQLGLEPGIHGDLVAVPTLINISSSEPKLLKQVSAGNLHSVVYSSFQLTPKSVKSYGIPAQIPEKYETIQHIPGWDLR